MLQWYLPEKIYWDISSIDPEWRLRGRSEQQTEQDWEESLAINLDRLQPGMLGSPSEKGDVEY